VGGKKDPVWRVVVADQRSPRDGRVIETLGHYNPQTAPSTVVIDEERARGWIARGAQPTRAVQKLLKIQVASAKAAEAPAEEAPAAEAPAADAADSSAEGETAADPAAEAAEATEGEPAAADGDA